MDNKEVVLINKHYLPLSINFQGVFPNNKRAVPGAKFYLTEKEYEWVKYNLPELEETGKLVLGGESDEEVTINSPEKRENEYAEFFAQHVNKAKSQASKLEDLDHINALIDYANDNEINTKAVDALIDRANELSE